LWCCPACSLATRSMTASCALPRSSCSRNEQQHAAFTRDGLSAGTCLQRACGPAQCWGSVQRSRCKVCFVLGAVLLSTLHANKAYDSRHMQGVPVCVMCRQVVYSVLTQGIHAYVCMLITCVHVCAVSRPSRQHLCNVGLSIVLLSRRVCNPCSLLRPCVARRLCNVCASGKLCEQSRSGAYVCSTPCHLHACPWR
jgi:uncharacterized membrane protein